MADRNSAAHQKAPGKVARLFLEQFLVVDPLQPKTGRGVGQSPTAVAVACPSELDSESLDRLVAFFRLLDEWERKLHAEKVM
jgi:hypothetical protein